MGELARIPLNQLVRGDNPRRHFDPVAMAELEEGIKAVGQVLQSIAVRRLDDGMFQIIAGERRVRGARNVLGEDYAIPANIIEADDSAAAVMAMIENAARENMSPVEEAERAARLLNEFGGDKEETARRLGWKVPMLENRLGLMNATDVVREALLVKKIQLGHAEVIAAAPKSKQDLILQSILAAPALPSVSELKAQLAQVARPLAKACFDTADCEQCPQNSSRQAQMFSENIGAGSCTGPDCYTSKTEVTLKAKRESLVDQFPRVEIVRAGDNYRVIKLKVEGPEGVSDEQGQACLQCKNFGAAIATAPDKMGQVFEGMCFDTACNSRMVAKNMRAATAAETANAGGQQSRKTASGTGKPKSPATSGKPAAASLSAAVIQFRKQLWRNAFAVEVVATPERSLITLLALAATHNGGHIESTQVADWIRQTVSPGADESTSHIGPSMGDYATALAATPRDALATIVLKLAGAAAENLEIHQVNQMLTTLSVDLKNHFKVDAEYLELLTKSEIEGVAIEIGLDKAYGEKFKSVFSKKKDELIKTLLAVQGFDFQVVPKALLLDTPERA